MRTDRIEKIGRFALAYRIAREEAGETPTPEQLVAAIIARFPGVDGDEPKRASSTRYY